MQLQYFWTMLWVRSSQMACRTFDVLGRYRRLDCRHAYSCSSWTGQSLTIFIWNDKDSRYAAETRSWPASSYSFSSWAVSFFVLLDDSNWFFSRDGFHFRPCYCFRFSWMEVYFRKMCTMRLINKCKLHLQHVSRWICPWVLLQLINGSNRKTEPLPWRFDSYRK